MSATETSYLCPLPFFKLLLAFPPILASDGAQAEGRELCWFPQPETRPSLSSSHPPFLLPGHGNMPRSEQGRVENRGAKRVGRREK